MRKIGILSFLIFMALQTLAFGQAYEGGPIVNNSTVATLPVRPQVGQVRQVTDGSNATDCVTGSGSYRVLCRWNGSAWENVGGQGGAGTGDVVGPSGATGNNFAAYDGSTGKLIKDSGVSSLDIPVLSTQIPVMDGAGSAGSGTKASKDDHQHPRDTTKQDTLTNPITLYGSYTVGRVPIFYGTNQIQDGGINLGTMTDGYYCKYTSSGTLIACITQYTVASSLSAAYIDWSLSSGGASILNKQYAFYNLGTVAGTDTYTATATPTLAAYVAGQLFYGIVTNANTLTTPTLNVTSKGPITIVKNGAVTLVAGDIPAGHLAIFEYDGTYMKLLNPVYTQTSISGNAATATALAANGTNCSSGYSALGVDASGNAEGCWQVQAAGSYVATDGSTPFTGYQDFTPITTPSVPSLTKYRFYWKADSYPYWLDSNSVETKGAKYSDLSSLVAKTDVIKLISFAWDGGGSAITTGSTTKRCSIIPHGATITGYYFVADQSTTTTLNVYKDAFSTSALATTDITGTHNVVVTTALGKNDSTLTDWTTSVTAGDEVCAQVAANNNATWAQFQIYGHR